MPRSSAGGANPGRCLMAAFCFAAVLRPSYADQLDAAFLPYAVTLDMGSWQGNAIYIGKGRFLTAAHLVGRIWFTEPKVVIGPQELPARVIKEGSPRGIDLALLTIEERLLPMRLRMRRIQLCNRPPWPGEDVVTVTPKAVAHSRVMSPERLPPGLRRLASVIGNVATTGNSGSGVFDVRQRCLLGIITEKISQYGPGAGPDAVHDIAKFFVPASAIVNFLPAGFRF